MIMIDTALITERQPDTVRRLFHFVLDIVKRDRRRKGWYVLPKRWIVERTLGWLGRYCLLNREYEQRIASSETDVYVASIRMMLSRPAQGHHLEFLGSL